CDKRQGRISLCESRHRCLPRLHRADWLWSFYVTLVHFFREFGPRRRELQIRLVTGADDCRGSCGRGQAIRQARRRMPRRSVESSTPGPLADRLALNTVILDTVILGLEPHMLEPTKLQPTCHLLRQLRPTRSG